MNDSFSRSDGDSLPGRWWQIALDLLLPPRCVGCGRRGAEVCPECLKAMRPLGPGLCPRCSVPSPGGRMCRQCAVRPHAVRAILARYPFEGVVRNAILALKYRSRTRLVPFISGLLEGTLTSHPVSVDLVIPVPLSASRERARGFNQSELLAGPLAASGGWALDPVALLRCRDTQQQTLLPARQRRGNVTGAFSVPEAQRVEGKRILLVDDVCTTGATLEACAEPILGAGATGVWAVVAARELTARRGSR